MDTGARLLLLCHAAITLILVGLILVIQFVHYPLFRWVGAETFRTYEAAHMNAMVLIAGPLMLAELVTGFLLLGALPTGVSGWPAYTGFGLILVLWGLTVFVNAPQHGQLASGFSAAVHHALLASNGVRTLLWLIRGGLVSLMLAQALLYRPPAP